MGYETYLLKYFTHPIYPDMGNHTTTTKIFSTYIIQEYINLRCIAPSTVDDGRWTMAGSGRVAHSTLTSPFENLLTRVDRLFDSCHCWESTAAMANRINQQTIKSAGGKFHAQATFSTK